MDHLHSLTTPAPHTAPVPEHTSDIPRWPEMLRDSAPPPAPFPWKTLIYWLLPGLVGVLFMVGLFMNLEKRASKQIVYVTADQHLGGVRADGVNAHTWKLPGSENTPIVGQPFWSLEGSTLAVQSGNKRLLLVQAENTTPISMTIDNATDFALVGQPWSTDSTHIALLTTSGGKPGLRIADITQHKLAAVNVQPNQQVPFAWHPTQNDLLVTVMVTATNRPALRLVTADGASTPFEPDDKQNAHMWGVWSPDGARVAYIAYTSGAVPAIQIWVANRDGGNPTRVISDGLNIAPVWSPKGDKLFFTRMITNTSGIEDYELYHVDPNGQNVVRVGWSVSPEFALQGQKTLIDWSPDGDLMYFQGQHHEQRTVYVANADGSNAQQLTPSAPISTTLAAHWSPTNRAVFVANGTNTKLYWLEDTPTSTTYAITGLPAWQP